MGQIFSWESIKENRIPCIESFHLTSHILRDKILNEPAIVSAVLFGSVVRRDFTIRSDLDCAVIYKRQHEQHALRTLHSIDQYAHLLHVPVNFVLCDTDVMQTRFHHLGVPFMKHIEASIEAGGLIKGTFDKLAAQDLPLKQDIESYIRMKMYRIQQSLAKAATCTDEMRVVFLQKVYEAPLHVARKVLIYDNVLTDDSKKAVQERYHEVVTTHLARQLEFLIAADSWYNFELSHQIGVKNELRYNSILRTLQEGVPTVLTFLRENILWLAARH